MSGTFMDGGGNGTLMDGGNTFVDGGHDHGSIHQGHGGDSAYLHSPQMDQPFADGSALGNILSHSTQNQHGFLAHLLGLDHDGGDHGGATHNVHGNPTGHVSQSAVWSSALQSLKLSDFTHGLNFTPAMGMFFLFAGFVGWLFVLYGIRHNEPLANAVLGTKPISTEGVSAYADRFVVNGTKEAIPIHRPGQLGDSQDEGPSVRFSKLNVMSAPPESDAPLGFVPGQPFGSPAASSSNASSTDSASSQIEPGAGMSIAAPVSAPLESYSVPALDNQPTTFAFRQASVTESKESAYGVSTVQSRAGRKLKFIVNN